VDDDPARFGASASLRELGSSDTFEDYTQVH
jgi:hypothetical protein